MTKKITTKSTDNIEKIEKGEQIIWDFGIKMPEKMTMRIWNEFLPLQKKIETGEVTEIEGIIGLYQIINTGEKSKHEIKDFIFNMVMSEFEAISAYIGNFMEKSKDAKK